MAAQKASVFLAAQEECYKQRPSTALADCPVEEPLDYSAMNVWLDKEFHEARSFSTPSGFSVEWHIINYQVGLQGAADEQHQICVAMYVATCTVHVFLYYYQSEKLSSWKISLIFIAV